MPSGVRLRGALLLVVWHCSLATALTRNFVSGTDQHCVIIEGAQNVGATNTLRTCPNYLLTVSQAMHLSAPTHYIEASPSEEGCVRRGAHVVSRV